MSGIISETLKETNVIDHTEWEQHKDKPYSASKFVVDVGEGGGVAHLIGPHTEWWKKNQFPCFWNDASEDIHFYRECSKTWNCMRMSEMKDQAKQFKRNGWKSRKCNLKTFKIKVEVRGTTIALPLYYMVFQKGENTQDITGMVAGSLMVDGYGYLFKSKSHRNKIHKIINSK